MYDRCAKVVNKTTAVALIISDLIKIRVCLDTLYIVYYIYYVIVNVLSILQLQNKLYLENRIKTYS